MRAVLIVLAGSMLGAGPPAVLTPGQRKLAGEYNALVARARQQWKDGEQDEAVVAQEKALELIVKLCGRDSFAAYTAESWLAEWAADRGHWREHVAHRERMCSAMARLRGPDDWRTKDARHAWQDALQLEKLTRKQREKFLRSMELAARAASLAREGEYADALAIYKEALNLRTEVMGERHHQLVRLLNNLAHLHSAVGEQKAALACVRRSLALAREAMGEAHPAHAECLNTLGGIHRQLGENKAALPCFRRAAAIYHAAMGEGSALFSSTLNNLALTHLDLGDHGRALHLLNRSLAICKETEGERSVSFAIGLGNVASALMSAGRYDDAVPLFRRAAKLRKEVQGETHPEHSHALNNLGLALLETGDGHEALPLLRRAAELTRKNPGPRHPLHATILSGLARGLISVGDVEAALPLFKKVLDIRKAALGERHPAYALGLNNLAGALAGIGNSKAALPLCKKALALQKELLGERHPDTLTTLNTLASLHAELEDHKAAMPLLKKALALSRDIHGEKGPGHVGALNNLGVGHQLLGDHEAALPLLEKAVELARASFGEKHPRHADALNALAQLRLAMKDEEEARRLSERALAITESRLFADAAFLSDRQQILAISRRRDLLDVRVSMSDASAHDHVLAWKGVVLHCQRQRRLAVQLAANPKTREATRRLREVTHEIASLFHSPSPQLGRLDELTTEQERLQAELSRLSFGTARPGPSPRLSTEALARTLPADAVLVDYQFHTRPRPHPSRLVAYVVRKGKPTARVDLGPQDPILEALEAWRADLVEARPAFSTGEKIKALVWSKLAKHLVGAKLVLVSPDGVLASVPFAALPGTKEGTYLIEDVAVAVVPAPREIPAMLAFKSERTDPSLLCVGGVDYQGDGKPAHGVSRTPRGVRRAWSVLPGTVAESAAVGKAFSALFEGGKAIELSRAEATKRAVAEALSKVRYAHLATHGYFAHAAAQSAFEGRRDGRLFGKAGLTGWHPLLLSGLVLSGANKTPKVGEEDGVLTALEVSEMDLSKLELAVLSACETGLGLVCEGEGLLGMQRAFQVAGARSVVLSLWSVDDKATHLLMSDFYRHVWDPTVAMGKAEALRRAQLTMLNGKIEGGKVRGVSLNAETIKAVKAGARVPPYYWAAWVLSGDWR